MDAEGPSGIFRFLQSSRRGDVLVPIALAKEAEAVKLHPHHSLTIRCPLCAQGVRFGLRGAEPVSRPSCSTAESSAMGRALNALGSGEAFIFMFCRCFKFTVRLSLRLGGRLGLGAFVFFGVWFLFFYQAHSLFLQNLH